MMLTKGREARGRKLNSKQICFPSLHMDYVDYATVVTNFVRVSGPVECFDRVEKLFRDCAEGCDPDPFGKSKDGEGKYQTVFFSVNGSVADIGRLRKDVPIAFEKARVRALEQKKTFYVTVANDGEPGAGGKETNWAVLVRFDPPKQASEIGVNL